MPVLILILLKVFLLWSISLNAYSSETNNRVIKIAGDQWCPYVCEKSKEKGFSVELVEQALRLKGFTSTYENGNFPRIIRNIEKGTWDVVTGTDESFSPELLISKVPVAYTRWVFVKRKDLNWKYDGPKSLEGLVLGVVAGYVYSPELMKYIDKNKNTDKVVTLFSSSPQEAALKLLRRNRIQVFIGEESVIDYWANEIGADEEFTIAGVDFEAPLYCGLNKADQKVSDLIDEGIIEFNKTKAFKNLLEKYQIKKWEYR